MELYYMTWYSVPATIRHSERYANIKTVCSEAYEKDRRLLLRFETHSDLWVFADGRWSFIKEIKAERLVKRIKRKRRRAG